LRTDGEALLFSQNYACPGLRHGMEELTRACSPLTTPLRVPDLHRLGTLLKIDPDLVNPDRSSRLRRAA
jgi:excinuclease UvrABC ATPase subunit